MPPKVGDILFAKTFDVYSEETTVRPGIVTRVFTEEDGEWAKDREIVSLSLFGGPRGVEEVDMDKAETDGDGEWVAGGWSDSYDGPGATATASTTDVTPTTVNTSPSDPASGTVRSQALGSLGTSADNPAADPAATSGANTGTVGDGSDTAPQTQPV